MLFFELEKGLGFEIGIYFIEQLTSSAANVICLSWPDDCRPIHWPYASFYNNRATEQCRPE